MQAPLKTTCIMQNQLYMLSHRIPSYKTSHHINECIPKGSFEFNLTALPTDKFQLIVEHDQTQRKLLEVHSVTLILYEGIQYHNLYS